MNQPPEGLSCLQQIAILALAIGLTLTSAQLYRRPAVCQTFCWTESCPPRSCSCGEQGSGFPFFVLRDGNCGGSPISGWGRVGSEDLWGAGIRPGFFLNILFYFGVLWLVWKALLRLPRPPRPALAAALACVVPLLIIGLAVAYPYRPWQTIARPPLMERGGSANVYYSADELERVIEYQLVLPTSEIRQFYATYLPDDGWRYACSLGRLESSTPMIRMPSGWSSPCNAFSFAPGIESIDIYERYRLGGKRQLLGVLLSEKSASPDELRVVQLREFR